MPLTAQEAARAARLEEIAQRRGLLPEEMIEYNRLAETSWGRVKVKPRKT